MRKISGVLLALAASLALGATTVAAKDYGDGGGGGEKMQNEGKGMQTGRGAEAVKKCVVTKSTATWSTIVAAIARVMHAPIAGAGAVRVSVAASGTTAAKKSAVSQTFNGGSSKGGRRLCEHMKPLAGSASAYLARFSRRWLHGFGDRKGGSGAGVGLGGSAWMSMTVLAGVMSLGAGGTTLSRLWERARLGPTPGAGRPEGTR